MTYPSARGKAGLWFATAVVSVICAIVPILAAKFLAEHWAEETQRAHLASLVSRALGKISTQLDSANSALKELAKKRFSSCSPEHIDAMRELVISAHPIDEVVFFENGLLKCSVWGPIHTVTPIPISIFETESGVQVILDIKPLANVEMSSIAVKFNPYYALVDLARLFDADPHENEHLIVGLTGGRQIGPAGVGRTAVLSQLASGKPIDASDMLTVSASAGPLVVVGQSQKSAILADLRQREWILIPLGVLFALIVVSAILMISRRRHSFLSELKLAVRNREFFVEYQPIVSLASGKCVGAEALVRWQHPSGETVRPDLFIPLSEESGLISQITDQIVELAVKDLRTLFASRKDLHVSINFCADDLHTGRALTVIDAALKDSGIEASQIWVEATERGFIALDEASATLHQARQNGHRVAIDDFGTGYSRLQHLQSLPLDFMKIDKAFIENIGSGSTKSSLTLQIIEMGRSLGLSIIAEGVETFDQVAFLQSHNVDFAQGWYYSRPLSAASFIEFCNQPDQQQVAA